MTVSVKAPTSTTGSIQLNGSDVLTIESDNSVDIDSGTLHVDATNNNVGIGTSSPAFKFELVGGTNNGIHLKDADSATVYGGLFTQASALALVARSNHALTFGTNDVERMRIDSSGDVLVGTTSKSSIAGVLPHHMFVRSAADAQWTLSLQNSAASGGARGLCINYSGQSPNNTTNEAMFFSDSVNYRFALRSNGGIANYSANNVNISDRREKTNFAPAKSYLQTICSIPVQTFNYIDQNLQEDDGLTLGVVAQDVQAVAPELVTESDWGSDGNPKMRLSVYQTDLTYALMKCIQEQQEIIKALETRIEALEAN